jgi:hypothetical protein
MKADSAKQIKRFLDARDLLHSAREQYEIALGALRISLNYADAVMIDLRDKEATRQIVSMRELLAGPPLISLDTITAIAETMVALSAEVSVNEEHVPAGVS